MLYSLEDGGLEAIVEARDLGQIRTGAASGVATKFMAREDASTIGIIGSGWEARSQIAAMNEVRHISHVKTYSRTAEKRNAFASEMREVHGLDVDAVDTAEECVRDVDILITITSSDEPVLEGSWIAQGTHVNGIGATGTNRRELDIEAVDRADLVVVENMDQARADCGELIYAEKNGTFDWSKAIELSSVVTNEASGRPSNDSITLFDALGVGTEDLAAAAIVLKKAKEQGIGTKLPL